jgi:hypothetical protein
MLCHGLNGSLFKGTYCIHSWGSSGPRKIDLWQWRWYVPMRNQVPLTQWCGITYQKTRILNYTVMNSSELKELVFLLYSKQCVSSVLLEKLLLVQLAILWPPEGAPCMVGMCWSRLFHLCLLNPQAYIPTSPKCLWLANTYYRVITGNICVNRMARELERNAWTYAGGGNMLGCAK